jgi:hypothetical protein
MRSTKRRRMRGLRSRKKKQTKTLTTLTTKAIKSPFWAGSSSRAQTTRSISDD